MLCWFALAAVAGSTEVVAYSFAKTPLKAAHAPLDMASASQVDLGFGAFIVGFDVVNYVNVAEC